MHSAMNTAPTSIVTRYNKVLRTYFTLHLRALPPSGIRYTDNCYN